MAQSPGCPLCGEVLKLRGKGLYRCKNSNCPLFRTVKRAATEEELEGFAREFREEQRKYSAEKSAKSSSDGGGSSGKTIYAFDINDNRQYQVTKVSTESGQEKMLKGLTCPHCGGAVIQNTNVKTRTDDPYPKRNIYLCGNCNHQFIYAQLALPSGPEPRHSLPPHKPQLVLPPHEQLELPPHEDEPEPVEHGKEKYRCPRCSDGLDYDIGKYIPLNRHSDWIGIYTQVGILGERSYDWGIDYGHCKQPFIIISETRREHTKTEDGTISIIKISIGGPVTLRRPNSDEYLMIQKQMARVDTKSKLKGLQSALTTAGTPQERSEIRSRIKDVGKKYSTHWGGINYDQITGALISFGRKQGFKEDAYQRMKAVLRESGVSSNDINDIVRKSTNAGEFEHLASRRILGRGRRAFKQRTDEGLAKLAERHGLSDDEYNKLRKRAQERSSGDLGFFAKIGQKGGDTSKRMVLALGLIIVGVILAAFMQEQMFLWGFLVFAFYSILPNPENMEYTDDITDEVLKGLKNADKSDNTMSEGGTRRMQLLAPLMPVLMYTKAMRYSRENRYNTGIATLRVILRVLGIVLIGLGLYQSAIPMAGFVYMIFVFASYYSLPIRYDIDKPDEFMGSIFRFLLGFFVPLSLLGLFGEGSGVLFWITLAFLLVFPVAHAKSEANALNMAATAGESQREMLDKMLFVGIMVFAVLVFMGLFNMGDLGFEGTSATVFWASWGIGLFAGVLSPAETRPYTGMLVIAVVFFLFMTGPGQQAVGSAFLGQWWPLFHNTMNSFTEPFGGLFETLEGTFGQTFTLLTNPVGYANQVMEGTYQKNPTGATGAYGVEIESINIPPIFPNSPAIATFNVKNVGPVRASNVMLFIEVPSEFDFIKFSSGNMEPFSIKTSDDKDNIRYAVTYDYFNMDLNEVTPFMFVMSVDCDTVNRMEPIRIEQYKIRDHFIPVKLIAQYEYSVESTHTVEFISNEKWKTMSAEGTFVPQKMMSFISTSPAKLSVGSFDQPIVESTPFYIGFNLSSAEGADSEILWNWIEPVPGRTVLTVDVPEDIRPTMDSCIPEGRSIGDKFVWEGNDLKNAIFCYNQLGLDLSPGINTISPPSKTFLITANSTFRFSRWHDKETRFEFSDVCNITNIGN
ncbi:MAG: hypothetical protein JW789_02225 [Candidatus Aenigmarchaeota archaeon]|nr:hypothetical protein [Candidatus Aenigmarchaeota archaeon]